jgi:hypothetical protein
MRTRRGSLVIKVHRFSRTGGPQVLAAGANRCGSRLVGRRRRAASPGCESASPEPESSALWIEGASVFFFEERYRQTQRITPQQDACPIRASADGAARRMPISAMGDGAARPLCRAQAPRRGARCSKQNTTRKRRRRGRRRSGRPTKKRGPISPGGAPSSHARAATGRPDPARSMRMPLATPLATRALHTPRSRPSGREPSLRPKGVKRRCECWSWWLAGRCSHQG